MPGVVAPAHQMAWLLPPGPEALREHQPHKLCNHSFSGEHLISSHVQVLLLDEPTAGLDPLSRHHVWNLLKEHRAGRVILFSTQFMDEADILAGKQRLSFSAEHPCIWKSFSGPIYLG